MSKVIVEGYIDVPAQNIAAVMAELPNHIALTRLERGCLRFEVKNDAGYGNRFVVYEEFVNREAFDAHQRRVKESRWGAITKDVLRHYRIRYL